MSAVFIKKTMRQKMCHQRKTLVPDKRCQYSNDCTRLLKRLPALAYAKHISVYRTQNGEMDLTPIVSHLLDRGKKVYLPVLDESKTNHLKFAKFTPTTKLVKNRYGIDEPDTMDGLLYPGYALDVVLTPIVAFDVTLNRLGMGGGFYDRTFSPYKNLKKPLLIGVAYEFQKVPHTPNTELDLPMDAIVTEKCVYLGTQKNTNNFQKFHNYGKKK